MPRVSISLTEDEADTLRDQGAFSERPLSVHIRWIVREWMRERGYELPVDRSVGGES